MGTGVASGDAAGERVVFEERVLPRRMLSVLWVTLALLNVAVPSALGDLPGIFSLAGAGVLALLAVKEWNRVALRVSDRAIVHQAPNWIVLASLTPAIARAGSRIDARDVAGVEWSGHDNIGIRRKDGRVECVFFRHRLQRARQDDARNAILEFVRRAAGSTETPAPEPASWVVRR